jgi:hypothetical protein
MLRNGEESALARHLDSCRACQKRLEELTGENGALRHLCGELDAMLHEEGSALFSVWAAAKDLSFIVNAAPPGIQELALAQFFDRPCQPGQLGHLGPYVIMEVLGRGGMGIVLGARDLSLGRKVAIKILAPHLASSPQARLRFAREAHAAAAIDHDHVVSIHAVDEINGLPYLVMQYVPGVSLQDRLDQDGSLPVADVLRIGAQVAAGLAAAHAKGLVHRDIKPGNILLENDSERVKLTDFGLARTVDDASQTQSGVIAGTPNYMAPEQARGEALDYRADLFSLGSVLYALCTGRHPFQGNTALAVLRCVSQDRTLPVQKLNPKVPEWLARIIARLHAKRPEDRFQSAGDVSNLLQRCLAHVQDPRAVALPAIPGLQSVGERGRLFSKRYPLRFSGMLGLLCFAVLLGGIFALFFASTVAPRLGRSPRESALATPYPRTPVRLRAALGHISGPVLAAAFAPGSEILATGGDDRTVRLWDLATLNERALLVGHQQRVWSVAIAPDGRTLASGSGEWNQSGYPGEVKIWDITTRSQRFDLTGHTDLVFCVAVSPDSRILASASRDRTIKLWDLANGKELATLNGHTEGVRFVRFSPDGKLLASGGFDGTVRLWELVSHKELAVIPCGGALVNCVAFSTDGKLLAAAVNAKWARSADRNDPPGYILLWDLESLEQRAVLRGHQGMILALAFSPGGQTLVSGGGDYANFGEVKVWNVQTGRELLALQGHQEWVECVTSPWIVKP